MPRAATVKEQEVEVVALPLPEPEKALTNYAAFKNAGVWPINMISQGYKPMFKRDQGTHTRILPTLDNIKRYADSSNPAGGGFFVQFRRAKTPCPVWDELAEHNVEVLDLTCDHCQQKLPIHSQRILDHMKNHKGANRRPRQATDPVLFRMTFGLEKPAILDNEAAVEDEGPGFID